MTNQPKMQRTVALYKIAMGEIGEMLTFVPPINESTPHAMAEYIRADIVERMAEALKYYADKGTHTDHWLGATPISEDKGRIALSALAAYEESRK